MVDVVHERARNRGDGRGGGHRVVEIEQRPALADAREVERGRTAAASGRREGDGRVELRDRVGEELRARLGITVCERAVGVDPAARHSVTVVLREQDVREARERQHLRPVRVGRLELRIAARDELGGRASALRELEDGEHRGVNLFRGPAIDFESRWKGLGVQQLVREHSGHDHQPFGRAEGASHVSAAAGVGDLKIADRGGIGVRQYRGAREILRQDHVRRRYGQQLVLVARRETADGCDQKDGAELSGVEATMTH